MATVTANLALDMTNIPVWNGTLGATSSSEIRFSDGVSKSCIYSGSGFSWDGTNLGGTGTGYSFYASANYTSLSWSITGASIPANDVRTYITSNNNVSGFVQSALSGADSITGSAYADKLYGYGGNDTINGGAGNDVMVGGGGADTYYVDSFNDTVTEITGEGSDTVYSTATSYNLGANIERLTLQGGAVNGMGNALDNYMVGNSAANSMNGGTGNDVMLGGEGNDAYVVDSFYDTITEVAGQGSDTVYSTSTSYNLGANIEVLMLLGGAVNGAGNALDNYIAGNSAANSIDGGAGNDVMAGGGGDDIYLVDSFYDTVTEIAGEGWDNVYSSAISYNLGDNIEGLTLLDTAVNGLGNALDNNVVGNSAANNLNGGDGNDTVNAGAGNDVAYGGTGNDTISGRAGNDAIYGGRGNDTINGGGGADTLMGGVGKDQFVFDAVLGSGIDTITDFSVSDDSIILENAIFASLTATLTLGAANFRIGTAADANDFIVYNSNTGALYYDSDGTGGVAAQQFATLSTGLTTLTNANFSIT